MQPQHDNSSCHVIGIVRGDNETSRRVAIAIEVSCVYMEMWFCYILGYGETLGMNTD